VPYKNKELSPLLDADLAGCQLANASLMAHPAGGVTYSVVCKDIGDEMLARLTAAANAGKTIRILFREARVVLSDVTIEPLEASTFRIAGRVLRNDAQGT
jgi:hypothetical protein